MKKINFWNGNKSPARQGYELRLLEAVLKTSGGKYKDAQLRNDKTDYPKAEDEASVFQRGTDVCVTVAGNPKFTPDSYLPVYIPLMCGLLGHRLLIIRGSDAPTFANVQTKSDLKQKVAGIPSTWADAPLFRQNQLQVNEKGSLEDTLKRLHAGECDYFSLGINEIHDILASAPSLARGLIIEPNLCLYYSFALVFYVNPDKPELVQEITTGLKNLQHSGGYDSLFNSTFETLLKEMQLRNRRIIRLENSALPACLQKTMEACYRRLMSD